MQFSSRINHVDCAKPHPLIQRNWLGTRRIKGLPLAHLGRGCLWREVHAAQEVLEAGVGAEGVH